jgi:serine/threonine protein kinase
LAFVEAWRGCHITEKVDVWAFGMILYELVTNTIPYQDLDTEESVKNEVCVQKKTPPIPEGIEVHPTLLDLMKKCWNWDPEQRPSFTEIVQTLEKTIMNVPKANEKFN